MIRIAVTDVVGMGRTDAAVTVMVAVAAEASNVIVVVAIAIVLQLMLEAEGLYVTVIVFGVLAMILFICTEVTVTI